VHERLELLDWKRRVFALYQDVRAARDPEQAWDRWRAVREELYTAHPQSPRLGAVPRYFDYDPRFRVAATVEPTAPELVHVNGSAASVVPFTRFARVRFELLGERRSLELYWLEAYGGGVFLPFADATSGGETYGAGRYLLDTVKGADLGGNDGALVLDFNFAYNPSCSYDDRWACPLAPPANRLDLRVEAGELSPG
jgi:uncharacterized protein (DUF1684 family)